MKIRNMVAAITLAAGLSIAAVPSALAAEPIETTSVSTTAVSQAQPQGFWCLFRFKAICRYLK